MTPVVFLFLSYMCLGSLRHHGLPDWLLLTREFVFPSLSKAVGIDDI